jgi:hypothetical protein
MMACCLSFVSGPGWINRFMCVVPAELKWPCERSSHVLDVPDLDAFEPPEKPLIEVTL